MARSASLPRHSNALDRAAIEIGYISIYWGWLEDALGALIAQLAGIWDDKQISQAITGNADIRDKVKICGALAFIQKPSDEWFDAAQLSLRTIDHNLRDRRNAFIHAGWYTPKGRLTRLRLKVQFKKPQSFQPPELTTEERRPIKISEARQLRKDIGKELRNLVFLNSYYQNQGLAERGVTFREFLLGAKEIHPRKKTRAKSPRQRRSASA